MLTHVALAVGLLSVGANPTTGSVPRQLPPAFEAASGSGVADSDSMVHGDEGVPGGPGCQGTYHGADGWSNHQFYGPQNFRLHFLISPRDMSQHMPYWNKERGYYYFRPYHPVHVIKQGERAASWGGDRNNPYDNRMLDRVHAEWLADEKLRKKAEMVEDLPTTPGERTDEGPEMPPRAEETTPEGVEPPTPKPEGGASRSGSSRRVVRAGFSKP